MPHTPLFKSAILALSTAILLGGCATKGFVREQVSALETRQNARMDAADTRMGGIEKTAQDALARADAAGKLAEGKFVYSVVLSDDSVKFPTGKAELSPEAEATLGALAQRLITENKNVYLEIQGYTDDRGAPANNLRLGQMRADSAMMFLHKQGIAASRMTTMSYGESEPVASNATAEGRASNRRIVVVVLN